MPEPHPVIDGVAQIRKIRVLQQFWETSDGTERAGDMFTDLYGIWKNVPTVMKND